jgi:hypothetical protein
MRLEMKILHQVLNQAGRAVAMPGLDDTTRELIEAYVFAVFAGIGLAYACEYLHPLITLGLLLVGIPVALYVGNWLDLRKPILVFAAIQASWFPISQPTYGLAIVPVVFGSIGAALAWRYLLGLAKRYGLGTRYCSDGLSKWLVYLPARSYLPAIPLALAIMVPLQKLYLLAFLYLVPIVQPVRVAFVTASPLIIVVLATIITAYATYHQRQGGKIFYRFLPAMTAALFAIAFPMYEPNGQGWWALLTAGDIAEWAFVLVVFLLGVFNQPGKLMFFSGFVAAIFSLLFIVFSTVPDLHKFMIAQSLQIKEVKQLPLSTDNPRIMPYIIGQKRCLEGNAQSAMQTGGVSFSLEKNGIYYQCGLHYDGFVAGSLFDFSFEGIKSTILSLIPGATHTVLRVESTNTSGEITPIPGDFPAGESSPVMTSAVLVRHPGATVAGFTYTEEAGKLKLVYSYTTPRLYWFTMVPTVGGAVVEDQFGQLQDYTVDQAADHFPGAFLVPGDLVAKRTETWAKYRLAAWWPFRQVKELSEPSDTLASLPEEQRKLFGDNKLPFAIDTQEGGKWWLLTEPAGHNGTAGSEVLVFDAHYPGLITMEDTTTGRVFKGLRDIVNQAPTVVTGNFGLKGSEVYLYVTKQDKYVIVPLMDPNGKFVGAAVLRSDETIVFHGAASSAEEVVSHIREFEQLHAH